MNDFKFIFIVLVYKNTDVLYAFFDSLKTIESKKVILVDSIYNEETSNKCKIISTKKNADYIQIPNKGYSYGNNIGIDFAVKNYHFEFLVISNSDIIIKDMEDINIKLGQCCILAPDTKMPNGKRQNPNLPYKISFYYKSLCYAYDNNFPIFIHIAHAISFLSRLVFNIIRKFYRKKVYKIFSPHGSFFIISSDAVNKLHPLFSNDMFLYNEESYLAFRCHEKKIPIYFIPNIKVLHLEGASSSNKVFSYELNKQSFSVFRKIYLDY